MAKGLTLDGAYLFLCGVMWSQYRQEDERAELLRASRSDDPDMRLLASAMLAEPTGLARTGWPRAGDELPRGGKIRL